MCAMKIHVKPNKAAASWTASRTLTIPVHDTAGADNKKRQCCICGKEFDGDGNNPEPVMPRKMGIKENRCCNDCERKAVMPVMAIIERVVYAARAGEQSPIEQYWDALNEKAAEAADKA